MKSMSERLIDITRPLNVCRASAGTGKTFTLAAYYVGLLLSGVDYRSILAITFTNKATAEMRERIMGYLYGISQGGEYGFLQRAKEFLIVPPISDERLRQRAGECFQAMLMDYDNMHVLTIDSFLQTLLSGLASMLKESVGLQTELDIEHVITTAVDQLLTTDMTEADRAIIEDYMCLKLSTETRLDVRKSLADMAKELYNESTQVLDADGQIVLNAEIIQSYRDPIEHYQKNHPLRAQISAQLNIIAAHTPFIAGLPNAGAVQKAVENIVESLNTPEKMAPKYRFRGLTDLQLEAASNNKWNKLPDKVVAAIVEATHLAHRMKVVYNTTQLTLSFCSEMQLMSSLKKLIDRNLSEANCALLAQTASTLHKALREGDAAFILEKVGIRYGHVLIDEFQDTSSLQWKVISQLLQDIIATAGNTVLIVGDIKQSIYRWRNGDWHIMDMLGKEHSRFGAFYNADFPPLRRNFRSYENVVRFNLGLFDHIVNHVGETDMPNEKDLFYSIYNEDYNEAHLEHFYQSESKQSGLVRFRAFVKDSDEEYLSVAMSDAVVLDMFDTIEQRLRAGEQQADMMILVRHKKEAQRIVDMHRELLASDDERYEYMRRVAFVSSDSFVLDASQDIHIIIAAMKYLYQSDLVEQKYIELLLGKQHELEEIKEQLTQQHLPLFELVNELIRRLLCDADGQYMGTEIAYINAFLDKTKAYISSYGGDIESFILYWDYSMHTKTISVSPTDAIRIMTIHASKGLQAKIVFIPFCSWTKERTVHEQKIWCEAADEIVKTVGKDMKYIPIPDKSEMKESAYRHNYIYEHQNMRIDNINMLYVALTRAEKELYLSTLFPMTSKGIGAKGDHVGKFILDYTQLTKALESDESYAQSMDGAKYWEFALGTESQEAKVKKREEDNPFSFKGAKVIDGQVHSNSDQVRFVQSQEGALYTYYGESVYERLLRMEEGTLCHNIFAQLQTKDQLESVLDSFQERGEIRDNQQREELKQLIESAWEGSPEMHSWFTDPFVVKMEHSVFSNRKELRPDRVMINTETNEAIVLDYKFGKENPKYVAQVQEYMRALRQIYSHVRGYLWYAQNAKGEQLKQVEEKEVQNG